MTIDRYRDDLFKAAANHPKQRVISGVMSTISLVRGTSGPRGTSRRFKGSR